MQYLTVLWVQLVEYWPAVFSVVLPFVVNLIAKCSWSSQAKSWLALGLSVLIGVVGAAVAEISFTPEMLVMYTATVFAGTTAAYLVFKRFGITSRWLDALLDIGSK